MRQELYLWLVNCRFASVEQCDIALNLDSVPIRQRHAQSALRKSLDDVTRLQKQQFATGIVVLFSLMICIFWLGHVSESHPVDLQKLVVAAMCFVLVSTFYVAMAFAALQLRMTKRYSKRLS
jgi:glucan phosphoethanolaminetransferase (alkaline phosphatase superfamily)